MRRRGSPWAQCVFSEGPYLRPQFIQPYRCKNLLIEDVTLFNSPMWQVHPVLCTKSQRPRTHHQHFREEHGWMRSRILHRCARRELFF
jgi:hypothetical protein